MEWISVKDKLPLDDPEYEYFHRQSFMTKYVYLT